MMSRLTAISTVKHKMCEHAQVDYNTVNWYDGSHHKLTWTQEQENEFKKWFINELLSSAIFRRALTRFPSLVKGKYHATKYANEFVFNYGFGIRD
jgi:hypothetical protein